MKLRTRLVLSSVLAIVATVAALAIYDGVARRRAARSLLIEIAAEHLATQREACEAEPGGWGGEWVGPRGHRGPPAGRHRPPPGKHEPPPHDHAPDEPRPRPLRAWAYDGELRAHAADAPALLPAWLDAMDDDGIAALPLSWRNDDVAAVLRTPWADGPCRYVLVQGSTGSWGAVLPSGRVWLLPAVVVLAAVMMVAGPMIRRIRQLTRAVERSASSAYDLSIPALGSDEVAELGRAFDRAARRVRDELEQRMRSETALREFLANTTHDLMIPLTVLQGHLAALRDRVAAGQLPEADMLRSAMNEAHYMGALVHNLGAVARLDGAAPSLQRTRVDLRDVVSRVRARHRPIAREAGVELADAVPAEAVLVDVDVTLIEQAVSNVVYNAVRYNHRGGHVAIVLERVGDDRFALHVVDDGPGIAPEQLARVRERGVRGDDARTRAPQGQGLGLPIALRVAQLHGLSLEFSAVDGGGLEVVLAGDRCRPQTDHAPRSEASSSSARLS